MRDAEYRRACAKITLGEVRHTLAAGSDIVAERAVSDPVLPWVRRTSRAIYERMKADLERDEARQKAAQAAYDRVIEDARTQAAAWREAGRDDYARRLAILLKTEL